MKILLFLIILTPVLHARETVFLERKGIIAIEAESTSSRLGSWEKKTDVADFSGECHLEFTGNSIMNGPPKSPLKYHFKVTTPGNYRLTIRARKRLETDRDDLSNDCYVSLKGDFEAGGGAPLKVLESDTKMFGGHATKWDWTNQLDFNHKKDDAIYRLVPGEEYELTISGRSKNFNFDRFLLIHESKDFRQTRNTNPDESPTADDLDKPKKPVIRTLIDKEGREVRAELERLSGNILHVKVKGRPYQIKLDILSAKDQEFIRDWAEESP